MGTPVVASDIGGLSESVRKTSGGLLFEPGNVGDLIDKVRHLIREPSQATSMGEYARQLVEEKYGPEQSYRNLMGIFERVQYQ